MEINQKDYVISISFMNYLKDKSGMPKVMMAHQQMFNTKGISYIGLFPIKKTLFDDKLMLFCKFGLLIDGEYKGIYQMSQLVNLFCQWCANGHRLLDIHIHHLLYMNLQRIDELLSALYDVPIKVYLHDYHGACCNNLLLKNRKQFCGGKGLKEEFCKDCVSFSKSLRVEKGIYGLYRKYIDRILFISPSDAAKEIFLNFHPDYADKMIVIPHQVFQKRYTGNLEPIPCGEKIRVAYLGSATYHKGWKTWERLITNADSTQYEFIVFNSTEDTYDNMRKVKVGFSQKNLNAMTEALRKEKIHVAVLWSMCAETYSYTCFEAYSANAMIVTNSTSGNIAGMVRQNGLGYVLDSEVELIELFQKPEEMRKLINQHRFDNPGGPDVLFENTQIVDMTRAGAPCGGQTGYKKIKKPVNYILLYLLKNIYRYM